MPEPKQSIVIIYAKAVMREIEKVVRKVMRDCRKYKIPIAKKIILDQTIAPERSYYAKTAMTDKGEFVIAFSSVLFMHYQHDIDEALRNIAAHELCHTCKGAMNHNEGWKKWVRKMNEHGYHINPRPYSKKESDLY